MEGKESPTDLLRREWNSAACVFSVKSGPAAVTTRLKRVNYGLRVTWAANKRKGPPQERERERERERARERERHTHTHTHTHTERERERERENESARAMKRRERRQQALRNTLPKVCELAQQLWIVRLQSAAKHGLLCGRVREKGRDRER
jgi:hypothetical protein